MRRSALKPSRARTLSTASLVLLAAACASKKDLLRSEPVGAGVRAPIEGVSYYLPKKVVRVDLYVHSMKVLRPAIPRPGAMKEGEEPVSQDLRMETGYFAVFVKDEVVPDLRHHFVIQTKFDAGSYDMLSVGVGSDGLLTHVTGAAQDQTREIAVGIARLASLLVTGAAQLSGESARMRADGAPEKEIPPRLVASYEFDPTDPTDLRRVRGELAKHGVTMTIEKQANCPIATSGDGCCTTCDVSQPGIYYRLPLPYRLQLNPGGVERSVMMSSGVTTMQVIGVEGPIDWTILVPNEAICKYVAVTRAAFVTKRTELAFDHGMLTRVSTDKPSELLGFVSIPVDVAKTIIGIPAELLKIRVDQKTQERSIVQNDADIRKAQADELDAVARILSAQKGQPPK